MSDLSAIEEAEKEAWAEVYSTFRDSLVKIRARMPGMEATLTAAFREVFACGYFKGVTRGRDEKGRST